MSSEASYMELPVYGADAHFTVSKDLGEVQFACDLDRCHGACCTMPADAGAPILESEIAELERVFPTVQKYLSEESLAVIAKEGLWRKERDGSLTIPAIRGRDCVFVMYEPDNKSAYCAIEKAHRAGEIEGFPKPISCHLFPIRIYPKGEDSPSFSRRGTEDGSFDIVYEEISECKGGRARGKRERIPLLDFVNSPLVRALGEERVGRLRRMLLGE